MTIENGFLRGNSQSSFFLFVFSCFFILLFATCSFARDVSLSWTASAETVDGYRIYYKTGSSGEPYNGTGLLEGASPVATGNATSITLHNLSDSETYYFAITAYLGSEESPFSTEFVLPADTPIPTDREVSLVWTASTETVDGYRLYYKTGNSGEPYDGTGATEGASPVETGNVTTFTLHGLLKTETYYFALTSYTGTAESSYSNEIVLSPSQVNAPPTATDEAIAVTEDTLFTGQLTADDPDGDTLVYSIVTNANLGGAVITDTATGSFTFTPNNNISGNDSFTFKVNDGTVDSGTATITVEINAVNDQPTANDTSISLNEDTTYSGQLVASDLEGDPLTFILVTNGAKGSATITNPSNGAFTYTPNANQTGSDSFTFKVNDGTVDSAAANVNVAIATVNDPPTATSASIATNEDTTYSGQLAASDPEGDTLTFVLVTDGGKGSVSITNPTNGSFTYTPNADQTGNDTFTFKVNDGTVDSAAATVTVAIADVNDPPITNSASFSTDENTTYTGQLTATDPDEDVLTFTIVTNGTKGDATITNPGNGDFTYTPNTNETGSDSFTFKANDGTVDSQTSSIDVTINNVNEAPIVTGTSITVNFNTGITGQLLASDPDGDVLTYSIVANGTIGSAVVTDTATGTFSYTPDLDATGVDSFTFKANDTMVDSSIGTVTVRVLDGTTLTSIFGDTPEADYPGTLADTYTNVNTDINVTSETLSTYSWAASSPYKIANTIIMKVDLSSIPVYATILEAKLVLYQLGANGEAQYYNSVHKISGRNPVISEVTGFNASNGAPWTPIPAGTTFNNIPLGLGDIDTKEDEILLLTQNGFRSWMITNMVQEWISMPSTNFGLLVKGEDTATETGRIFASTQNNDTVIRPKLIVRYKLTPPAPRLILIEEIK